MPWFGKKSKCSGFEDDLSDAQLVALESFKEEIVDQELSNDPRYTDSYLLRFLRANNFKVNKTLKMFKAFLEWRENINADQAMVLYRFPIIKQVKELYKYGYHKTDREGRPVWIDHLCQAKVDECLSLVTPQMMEQYYTAEYERLIHCILPACSKAYGSKVDTTFSVIDCKGFKMSLMGRKNREFLNGATNMGQNYYPELMWKMFVINTPFVFRAAWSVIKSFLNERTRDRIKLYGSKYHNELFKIVDPDNLPTSVGGNCCCTEEYKQDCLTVCPGPWDDFPGDEIGEAAIKEIQNDTTANDVDDYTFLSEEIDFEGIDDIVNMPKQLLVKKNSLIIMDKKNKVKPKKSKRKERSKSRAKKAKSKTKKDKAKSKPKTKSKAKKKSKKAKAGAD